MSKELTVNKKTFFLNMSCHFFGNYVLNYFNIIDSDKNMGE